MTRDIFSLSGKVVVIASDVENFAKEIASGVAEFGAKAVVILPSGYGMDCASVKDEAIEIVEADFQDDKSIVYALEHVCGRACGIDVLVTRFGIERPCPLIHVTEVDLKTEFEAVWVPLRVAQLCRSSMIKKGGGVIVNVLPISASWPGGLGAARAMASAAGLVLSQSLALAGAADLIRSVAISVAGGSGQPNGMAKRNLIGRGPQMDEVVAAIVALASGAGGFTTATNLILDGGELAL